VKKIRKETCSVIDEGSLESTVYEFGVSNKKSDGWMALYVVAQQVSK